MALQKRIEDLECEMKELKPGDKIEFLKDIIEPACGDHPEFQMAYKGQEGLVISACEGPHWNYGVTSPNQEALFYVEKYEIKAWKTTTTNKE